eukprot:TRINITY_DN5677_c0_g1_i2.p1 TRINITY_DN5677_c0_g1~~TRINITY_DN5677_c0_g1_i2.p1  ORF type:complete len:862 (+),score=233.88 TRINITY_DN5677_c0_g1_i2:44-2629(+)
MASLKRSLTSSADKMPLSKKSRYSEYSGFSDENTVRLNALKAQCTELFCKQKQQQDRVREGNVLIETRKKEQEDLEKHLPLLEQLWQKLIDQVSESLEVLHCSRSREELMAVANTDSRFLKQLYELYEGQEVVLQETVSAGAGKELKQRLVKKSLELEWKFLQLVEALEKAIGRLNATKTEIFSTPGMMDASYIDIHGKLQHNLNVHRGLAVNIFKLQSALLGTQASLDPFRERERRLEEARQGIKEEKEKQRELMGEDPEEEVKKEQYEEVGETQGEEFEYEKLQTEIQASKKIMLHKEKILKSLREEHEAILESIQKITQDEQKIDSLRSSTLFRSTERKLKSAEAECAFYSMEAESLEREVVETHNQGRWDVEQKNRLRLSQNKTMDEKVTLLGERTKQVEQNIISFSPQVEQRKSAQPDVEKMREMVDTLMNLEIRVGEEREKLAKIKEHSSTLKAKLYELWESPVNIQLLHKIHVERERHARILRTIDGKDEEIEKWKRAKDKVKKEAENTKLLLDISKARLSADELSMLELMAQEKSLLEEKEELSKSIASLSQSVAKPKSSDEDTNSEKELQEFLPKLEEARRILADLQRQEEEEKKRERSQEKEREDILGEIEEISSELLRMQSENIKTTKQLKDSEETSLNFLHNIVKQEKLQTLYLRKQQIFEERLVKTDLKVEAQEELLAKLEKKKGVLEQHYRKANEEMACLKSLLEAQQTAIHDGGLLHTELKAKIDETWGEIQAIKSRDANALTLLEKEKASVNQVSEELIRYQMLLEFYTSKSKNEGARDIEQQLNHYKQTLRCSVCNDRMKDSIITRCFHTFCRQCIETNLQTRHRKCDGCGIPFGKRDVQQIYL